VPCFIDALQYILVEVVGANHEVNSTKISHNFLDDDGAVLVR